MSNTNTQFRVRRLKQEVGNLNTRLPRRAFTLIELMVAMGLMSVIIIGLVLMFNQTQRAFRVGMMQTDILESGRVATDLISSELAQVSPFVQDLPYPPPNFYVHLVNVSYQNLPASSVIRTNFQDDLFFLIRRNQTWTGIGYFVRTNRTDRPSLPGGVGPVGTLYRYETNYTTGQLAADLAKTRLALYHDFLENFDNARQGKLANVSRLLDGVVNFKVRTYTPGGVWINPYNLRTNTAAIVFNNLVMTNFPVAGEVGTTWFYSNAVPAYVEVQIGVLEQKTLQQYESIPNATARANFFSDQAGHVHLFRQRIAVRNMDPTAYYLFYNNRVDANFGTQ